MRELFRRTLCPPPNANRRLHTGRRGGQRTDPPYLAMSLMQHGEKGPLVLVKCLPGLTRLRGFDLGLDFFAS